MFSRIFSWRLLYWREYSRKYSQKEIFENIVMKIITSENILIVATRQKNFTTKYFKYRQIGQKKITEYSPKVLLP